jgi:hypothetical protein
VADGPRVATDTTGGYCAKHDRHYSALGDCDDCRDARRGAVAQGSPKADLRELELREGEFRADAKYLRRRAREWIDDGTAQERNIALKAFDTAAKYERLALEIHAKVIEVKHDHWLRDENMKISGGSGN